MAHNEFCVLDLEANVIFVDVVVEDGLLQRVGQIDFDLVWLAQFHVDGWEFDNFCLGDSQVEFVPELSDGVRDEPECATPCEGQQGGELEVVFLFLQGVDIEDALSY